jgi:peptide/nickel transport system permease protein
MAHTRPRSAALEALLALWRRPHIRACMIVVAAFLSIAIAGYAHLLPDHEAAVGGSQDPPSWHPATLLGTDILGRSVLWRVLAGAQTAITIGLATTALAVPFGTALGLAAGYFGGWLDEVIMRVTDIFLAFPPLLLSLALAALLPTSLVSVTIAIAVTWWPWYTRLIRGQAASVAGRPYIESCRALGIPRRRIIFRHILPNSVTPLIVQVSLDIGGVILTASALSFLGLGAQDPTPEWGLMVAEGQGYFSSDWWVVTFPGIAILVTAFAFNLLGDGLRDLLDPKRGLLR